MDLAEEIGSVALDTFIMPRVHDAVAAIVAKDPYRTAAQKAELTAELTQALRDGAQVGLEDWMASRK
jgi:hypothetical protein